MISSFRFGVAFERLRFSALNRYLLKNSSSIETEIRSLILPLGRMVMLVINIYRYTFDPEGYAHQQHTMEAPSNPQYAVDSQAKQRTFIVCSTGIRLL
jgi:hypothetical protein